MVVVNSEALRHELAFTIDERCLAVARQAVEPLDGVSSPRCRVRSDRELLRALMVGRVAAGKGHDVAIAGIADAVRRGAHVTLTIVGSGSESEAAVIDGTARRHHVSEFVSVVTWTDDPRPYYAAHDVELMCSVSEAFGSRHR